MRRLFSRLDRSAAAGFLSVLLLAGIATAGSLTPGASPASTMHSLEELYDSIAGTFDSSGITASDSGSLIEHLKYIEANMATGSGVSSDSLDFDEFVDSMTLDADTSIASGGFVLTVRGSLEVGDSVASSQFGRLTIGLDSTTNDRQIALVGTNGGIDFFRQRGSYPCCGIFLADITSYANTTAQGFTTGSPAANISVFTDAGWAGIGAVPAAIRFLNAVAGDTVLRERMRISSGGNVGIGVGGDPATGANIVDARLEVVGSTSFTTSNVASISGASLTTGTLLSLRVPTVATFSGGILRATDTNNTTLASLSAGGNFELAGYASLSQTLFAQRAGNVGIGTTTPASRLHVVSSDFLSARLTDSRSSGLRGPHLELSDGAGNVATIDWIAASSSFRNRALEFRSSTNGRINFYTNNSTAAGNLLMTIASSGNVGLGVLNPTTKLEVIGATSVSQGFEVGGYASLSQVLFVQSAGNIGVGTTSPLDSIGMSGITSARGIEIAGPTGGRPFLELSALNNIATVRFSSGSLGMWDAGKATNNDFFLDRSTDGITFAQGTFRIVNATGNVGINTTSPQARLEVGGTASAAHLLTRGGLQVANGGASVSYSRFGTATTGHSLLTNDDLLISGDLEVNGVLYADGGCVGCGGVSSDSLDFDEITDAMTLDANTSIASGGFALHFGDTDTEFSGTASLSGWTFSQSSLSKTASGSDIFASIMNTSVHGSQTQASLYLGNDDFGLNQYGWLRYTGSGFTQSGLSAPSQLQIVQRNPAATSEMLIHSYGDIVFGADGGITAATSEHMRLTGTGLAIGTGPDMDPDARLDVEGNILASTSGNVDLVLNSTGDEDARFTLRSVNSAGRLAILSSASTELFSILASGNATFRGTVLPATTESYDLGSSALRWRAIYVSSGSLHIGSPGNEAVITYDSSGADDALVLNGLRVYDSGTASLSGTLEVSGNLIAAVAAVASNTGDFEVAGYASISEYRGGGLTDCDSSSQKLLWDAATGLFSCGTDQTGGGGGSSNLQVRDFPGSYESFPATISFDGGKFTLTASGASDVTVGLDWGAGGPASLSQNETVTGAWTFSVNPVFASGRLVTSNSLDFDEVANNTTLDAAWNVASAGFGIDFNNTQLTTGTILPDMTGAVGTLSAQLLGGPNYWWQDIYVESVHMGDNSLYVNGNKVLSVQGTTMEFTADSNQNLSIETDGSGNLVHRSRGTGTLQLLAAQDILASASGDITLSIPAAGSGNIALSNSSTGGDITMSAAGIGAQIILTAPTTLVSGDLETTGYASAAQVFGAGLADCDGDTQTLSWDASTGRFGCGDDDSGGGGSVSSDSLDFDEFAESMTLDANTNIASAGFSLTLQQASVSGDLSARRFYPLGLTDCDTAASSKLLWDATTGTFSCGSDQQGAGSAGGWTDGGTTVSLTAATDNVGIGTSTINAGQKLEVLGAASVSGDFRVDAADSVFFAGATTNNVGIGTSTTTARLTVLGEAGANDILIISSASGTLMSINKEGGVQFGGSNFTSNDRFVQVNTDSFNTNPGRTSDISAANDLFVTGDVEINGILDVGSDASVSGDVELAGGRFIAEGIIGSTVITTPVFTFDDDQDTGIGHEGLNAANKMFFVTGGNARGMFDATGNLYLANDLAYSSVGSAKLHVVGVAGTSPIARFASVSGGIALDIGKTRALCIGGCTSTTDGFQQINTDALNQNPTRTADISALDDLFVSGDLEVDGILDILNEASFSADIEMSTNGTQLILPDFFTGANVDNPVLVFNNDRDTGLAHEGSNGPNRLFFVTAGNAQGLFDASGNFVLDSTVIYSAVGTAKLDVTGTAGANSIAAFASSSGGRALIIGPNQALIIGGGAYAAADDFNQINNDTANNNPGRSEIGALTDLFIQGDLEVNGILDIGSLASLGGNLEIQGVAGTYVKVPANSTSAAPGFTFAGDEDTGIFDVGGSVVDNLGFGTGGVEAMRVNANQYLGIGTTAPAMKLHIASTSDDDILRLQDSDGTCSHNPESGAETVTCSSDERLKEDIRDASSALAYWGGFRIREYTVRASGDRMVGVIAQELLETHPELVSSVSDGLLTVQQPNPWLLVKAVQELNAQLSEVSERLSGGTLTTAGPATSLTEELFQAVIGAFSDVLGIVFESEGRIKAQELCLEDVCVTKEQLRELLEGVSIEQSRESDGDGEEVPVQPEGAEEVGGPPADAPVDSEEQPGDESAESPRTDDASGGDGESAAADAGEAAGENPESDGGGSADDGEGGGGESPAAEGASEDAAE